jgi:hypothetical protein
MGKRFGESFGPGHSRTSKKYCRVCFKPARSGLGEVCHRKACQAKYLQVWQSRGW